MSDPATLLERITNRTAKVGVVGLGYVGLPLAVEFAHAGFQVTGIDLDARKVAQLNRGESYIQDVPTAVVAPLVSSGKLSATTNPGAVRDFDTINICVPTPLRKTKDPDLSFVVAAVEAIAGHLHPGMLVILESTTYPGTTEEVVQPILEKTGLKAGVDFFLAFSPERVDPGNEKWTTEGRGRAHARLRPPGGRVVPDLDRRSRGSQLAESGRDGETTREHLPGREHRHGE
jgi:UDP-N-acetyl-D-glucosamine dehydrogenase